MLNNLVESRNHTEESRKKGGILLMTFFVVATMLLSGVLWSLFAKEFTMGSGELEVSTLVAPVPAEKPEPPKPAEDTPKQEKAQMEKTILPTRNDVVARLDESPTVPDKVSVTPNTSKARPKGAFLLTTGAELDPSAYGTKTPGRNNSVSNYSAIEPESKAIQPEKTNIEEPPPIIEKPAPKIEKKVTTVSKGVINGTAINLPVPNYPAAAKIARAGGNVNVAVTIDETGNVISANAVSGHALLKSVSEDAARRARFKPTLLSNQPVKVTGVIIYKFGQ